MLCQLLTTTTSLIGSRCKHSLAPIRMGQKVTERFVSLAPHFLWCEINTKIVYWTIVVCKNITILSNRQLGLSYDDNN